MNSLSHALPNRALKLISEYSKPITRGDWRTFIRTLSNNIFLNDIQKLNNYNTLGIFTIVNKYDYIYPMNRQELNDYIRNQRSKNLKKLEINLRKKDFIYHLEEIKEKKYLRRTIKNY